MISTLSSIAPEAVRGTAESRQPEWNRLYPGTFPDAPLLADLAGTPSERRLHAESEQVFRVLDTAAEAIVAAMTAIGRPLHLRGVGYTDLLSLRGLPRILERLALAARHPEVRLHLHDVVPAPADLDRWDAPPAAEIRRRMTAALAARLGVPFPSGGEQAGPADGHVPPEADGHVPPGADGHAPPEAEGHVQPEAGGYTPPEADPDSVTVDEHRLLTTALDPAPEGADSTLAAAAALLAMRSCFFACNHEGGVLAARALLDRLAADPDLAVDRVREHFTALDPGDGTPAIGIHAEAIESVPQLRSLALRYLGMVRALVLDHDGAREEFTRAVEAAPDAITEARVLLLRALLSVKRAGMLESGTADIDHGLERLSTVDTPTAGVERAWLRNVRALAHVRSGEYAQAMAQEKQAVALIGRLHSADATHLKINLISNISVLQEMAKKYDAATRTWDQFARISTDWGDSFFKHHHYRAAGLHLRAGRHTEALEGFTAAYDIAHKLADHLHRQLIALEIGGMLLDLDRPEEARTWYERAEAAATTLADPYTLALARTGVALAAGTLPDGEAVRRTAALSCAQLREAHRLCQALDAADDGDPAALRALLPRPKTKLNRPFLLTRADLETP
ncbi:tetratricopeptide repeat protein [Streptomyces huiliensis]|uniref:tetratricopeptide repeat protein n=1 Tax=Streptomyces huiliensis TaxID=2876027 RepID=UPI001CBBD26F|nr:tetratricopeptide repeat protein [Streptomyces huiliensis]MBZ4319930.1 tetratricopeptide repeat protein [Streptomyces huiliensis]